MLVALKPKLLVVLIAILALSFYTGIAGAQTAATVKLSQHPDLGSILTDATGMTLYLFTNDERNKSNCAGNCATAWPPLLTTGDPVAGEELQARALTTVTRADGGTQVAYNGWPLYYFARDTAVGDATGQNVGGNWFVVSTHGGPIQNNAPVNTVQHAELGTILVDISGRSQYLFTPDERNKSNCSGACALAWPPLITVGDPVAGEGVSSRGVGTIVRDDGYTQVTYNGWPLYYFFRDDKPGDTNGQDSRGVWYVLSTDGGAVWTTASVKASQRPWLGTILVDDKGRALYLFTRDEAKKSNCAGGCALAWPPLITVGDPTAGGGVDAALLGTTERAGGHKQVTYKGRPLYYYAQDVAPGHTSGQAQGNVWFLLRPSGQAAGIGFPLTGDIAFPRIVLAALLAGLIMAGVGGVLVRRTRSATR